MRLILKTCKVKTHGIEEFLNQVDKEPSIIMMWHNRVTLGPNFFGDYMPRYHNYTAYVSQSRDGDWLARTTEYFPNGFTIRVPKKEKHRSLRSFIKTLKKSILLITPDGPRGPIYTIKPGVILAAEAAKAQIFPFSWSANKYWRLKTWDRMILPKPFSTIHIGYGAPFKIERNKSLSAEEKALIAQQKLIDFKEFMTKTCQARP